MIGRLTGLPPGPAQALARRAGGRPNVALVMHRLGLDAATARKRLAAHGDNLRSALEE
jgi:N-acetylmuramic acid 6-phosphate (MurNAc-6-P) etherase